MASGSFQDCALLLIDLQTVWTEPCIDGPFPELPDNMHKLVEFARQHGMLIVHVWADYNEQDTLWFDSNSETHNRMKIDVNKPDFDIVKPLKGEKIVYKSTFDGFFNTTLNEYLRHNNIAKVYGCGVATSVCVLNTLHGAFIRGFKTFIVKDCCADLKRKYHDACVERYFYMLTAVDIADNLQCKIASKL